MTWVKAGLFAASTALLTLLFHSLRRKKRKHHANPFVQGVNRLKSHTILGSFESALEARNNVSQIETSPFVSNLGGIWQFRLFSTAEEALSEVHSPSPSGLKEPIHVPGHWQLQGFNDHPIYTNIKYIIPVDPPNVPDVNPSGYYEREYIVMESWADRRIVMSFGGVDNAFYLWVNHVFIGFSKDSRVECEFDLTEVTKFGGAVNMVQVVVLRYSDGTYLEDQDMWNFSGIFRDVHLISFPKPVHISDFNWKLDVDNVLHNCDILLEVELRWDVYTLRRLFQDTEPHDSCHLSRRSPYASCVDVDWIVCTELYEEGILVSSTMQNGGDFILHDFNFDSSSDNAVCTAASYAPRPVGPGYQRSFTSWLDKSRNDKKMQNLPPDTTSLKQRLNVVSPGLWSAERPFVYTLVISLRNARDNTIVQAESCRLGFRSVEIADGVLRVNQKPIMIRGVNYHEHDPVSGHCVNSQLLEADLKLMKRHNFNAVRTSHYPQTPMFYELCTLYGLFVVDEANIETHGMTPYAGRLADSLNWERAFTRRVVRMLRCHRNHTCIISWSLGNESGYGRTHDKLAALVRKHESDRVLMYEPASYGPRESNNRSGWFGLGGWSDPHIKKLATDVLCPMYPRVEDCIILANRNPDLPVILCEYAHMMGNSGGNLDLYWKWFNNFARLQGGFIWDWADQGISTTGPSGKAIWAYGGDFGESYHDGTFCLNGLNWPDRGLGTALTQSRSKCADVRYARFSRTAVVGYRKESDGPGVDLVKIPSVDTLENERRKSLQFLCGSDNAQLVSGSADNSWLLDHMKVHRHVYGLQRVVRSLASKRSNYLGSSYSVPVDDAVAKPQLLEAKQCMKVFDCEVTSVHPTMRDKHHGPTSITDSSRNSSMNMSQTGSTPSVTSTEKLPAPFNESQTEYQLSLTVHYSILNRLNHIKSIEEYLQFDVLLLCDGMIVDRKPMKHRGRHGSTNRRHVFDPEDGMVAYMQEVEMLCQFSVPLRRWRVPGAEPITVDQRLSDPAVGDTDPPALPLSRCTAITLPTAIPTVLQPIHGSPKLYGKNSSFEMSPCYTRPNIGWTVYGHVWPEDAMLATDSFDHLPFPHHVCNTHAMDDLPISRLRQESVSSQDWHRGNPRHDRVSTVHESHPNLQSKRKSFTGNADNCFEEMELQPSLWSDITPNTKWSTVVVGRLIPDTPWAEAGYPMGFAQCGISGKLVYSLLPSVPNEGPDLGGMSLPPRVPTPSDHAHVRVNSTSEASHGIAIGNVGVGSRDNDVFPTVHTCTFSDDFENEVNIEHFGYDMGDHLSACGNDSTLREPVSGGRKPRLRSRSGSWTDPGNSAVLNRIAENAAVRTEGEKLCSAYNVAVFWAPRESRGSCVSEGSDFMASPDILLRADASNMHPEDEAIFPRRIEVTIDGSTGSIRSILCNGTDNILLTECELQHCGENMQCSPSRFQLHRAPTDNDRMGYLSGWSAAGLDRELVPVLNEKFMDGQHETPHEEMLDDRQNEVYHYNSTKTIPVARDQKGAEFARTCSVAELPSIRPHEFPVLDDLPAGDAPIGLRPLDGTTELPFLTVVHVMVNSNSKPHQNASPSMRRSGPSVMDFGSDRKLDSNNGPKSCSAEEVTEAFGVTCKWKMSPRAINSSRVAIIRLLSNFVQDSMQQVLIVEVESNASEVFVHEAAARLQLGRQSIRPLISKDTLRCDGTSISILACRVRLWKPVLYMNSTTVKAEDLNMGPYGGLTQDEDIEQESSERQEVIDGETQRPERPVPVQYQVHWEVTYSLSTKGELLVRASLDCSQLPVVVPRIGLSLALRQTKATTTTLWRGLGPHENYPDRVAACVNAVHEAPTKSLYTPYIRPSENGSRSGVCWVQLNTGDHKAKVGKEPMRGENNDSEYSETRPPSRRQSSGINSTVYVLHGDGKDSNMEPYRSIPNEDLIENGNIDFPYDPTPGGCAMTIRSSKAFNFSIQEYSTEALSVASHSTALNTYTTQCSLGEKQSAGTDLLRSRISGAGACRGLCLNVDPFLMGVGGDDSWSSCVHEEFTLPPKSYSFKISMSFHYL